MGSKRFTFPRAVALITGTVLLAACGSTTSQPAASSPAAASSAAASGSSAASASSGASARSSAPASSGAASASGSGEASSGASGSGATKTLRVGTSVAASFDLLPVYVGDEVGVWSKRGIKVEETSFGGEGPMMQALAANSLDLGYASTSGVISAVANGGDVKIIADVEPSVHGYVLIGGPGINSVDDLKGKGVGVTSHGSITEFLVNQLLASKSWTDGKDLTVVYAGGLDQQLAALKTKQTAAFVWTADAGFKLEEDGSGKIVLGFDSIVKNMDLAIIAATDRSITKDPALMKAYVDGYYEAVQYVQSHKDETVKIGAAKVNVSPTVAAKAYDFLASGFTSQPTISKAGLQGVIDFLVQKGTIKPPAPDPASAVVAQFTTLK